MLWMTLKRITYVKNFEFCYYYSYITLVVITINVKRKRFIRCVFDKTTLRVVSVSKFVEKFEIVLERNCD